MGEKLGRSKILQRTLQKKQMKKINIIFPHQLFKDSPLLSNDAPFYLVEEYLLFKQYKFHKQPSRHHAQLRRFPFGTK
jgi:deoxyribodipyrimidine photolyase-related protein